MKKVFDYWFPDTDNHFERLIIKQVNNGRAAEYQDDVRNAAYKYVKNFDIAVDVGANVGLWAKPLANKFDHVIAFEPLDFVFNCLRKNVESLNVELHQFALGNFNDKIEMSIDINNTGNSFISNIGNGSFNMKRLDDLNLAKFDLLKIDCERHELEVLKGGIQTILKYKPIIVVEQHPDVDYSSGRFLVEHGAIELERVRKDYIFGW
jgi:FkbM family methyltransferase